MWFALALLAYVLINVITMQLAGGVWHFVNPPSVLLIVPVSVLFGIAASSPKSLVNSVQTCFKGPGGSTQTQLHQAKRGIMVIGNSAVILGIAALCFALISIGSNFVEIMAGGHEAMGLAIAIAFSAPLYSAYLKALCYLIEKTLDKYLDDPELAN